MPTRQALLLSTLLCCLLAPGGVLAQKIVADPVSLVFSFTLGGALPAPRTVGVGLDTGESTAYTVETVDSSWLVVSATSGRTPDTITVSVNVAGLDTGFHVGSLRFRSSSSSWTTPVSLFIHERYTDLTVNPRHLLFEAQPGAPPPPAGIIQVASTPNQTRKYTAASSGAGWLKLNPTAGVVPGLTPSSIEVLVDQDGVLPGTYDGAVNIADEFGRLVQSVVVQLVVSAPSPIRPSPAALGFHAVSGVDAPQSKNVTLTAIGGGALLFGTQAATVSGGDWLSVSPAAGITPMIIAVTINAAGLPIGTYQGAVTLNVLSRAVRIPVTLTVTGGPALVLSSIYMEFSSAAGVAPNPRPLVVDSLSGGPVPFVAATTADWLGVSPTSGTTLATLTVSPSPAGLAPGRHRGTIDITAAGSSIPLTVTVILDVTDVTTLRAAPTTLSFVTVPDASGVGTKSISVTSGGVPLDFTTGVSSSGWLSASQSATSTPAQVEVAVNPAGLAPGSYQGQVTLASPASGNEPVRIPITLEVEDPRPHVAAVVHGASLTSGIFAAGTIVTVYGGNLGPPEGQGLRIGPDGNVASTLAGVRVLFDETPGPLIYVRNQQVNVVTPYALDGKSTAELVVEYDGRRSTPVQLRLAPSSPGIFSADSTGQGPGAILNRDYSLNHAGHRAAAGDVVIVYATGAGQTVPPGEDGAIGDAGAAVPALPVQVFIGGVEAEVQYAGSAPGLVAGVLQLNTRIPPSLLPGTYPITIRIGEFISQPGVTVAVK